MVPVVVTQVEEHQSEEEQQPEPEQQSEKPCKTVYQKHVEEVCDTAQQFLNTYGMASSSGGDNAGNAGGDNVPNAGGNDDGSENNSAGGDDDEEEEQAFIPKALTGVQ